MAPQIATLKSGLDSLRVVVDTMVVRDSIAYALLVDTRRELDQQRDVLLSTRATTGSTTQQVYEQMERLDTRLDETLRRFNEVARHSGPAVPVTGSSPDPQQLYDQATADLTQGRYGLALQELRDFVRRFPSSDLADDAQYGIGECFFARSSFDSAAVEYARVGADWPQGDRVPASLYKLALSQDGMGQKEASKRTLQDLVKRFPQSGEAQLARAKLGASR
jgi:tol-pal system protein YbgF